MTITFASWKGGTGKTTLAIMLARIMAAERKRTLIIDLDSNCAISGCFGKLFQSYTSANLLTDDAPPCPCHCGDYTDIIPSDIKNLLLSNIMDTQLKTRLKKHGLAEGYDLVIIDPPGTWGAHTKNAVFAADRIVIPGTCSRIDFEAAKLFFGALSECGLDADVSVCVNGYSERSNQPGVYELYEKAFGEYLIAEPLPYAKAMKKVAENADYAFPAKLAKRFAKFAAAVLGTKEESDA